MKKNNTPLIKRLLTLLSMLMIGALGSGLWDIFLKDFIFNTGGLFVNIMSHFYSGYIDSLYRDVGRMMSPLELLPSIFFVVFIIISPIISILIVSIIYRRVEHDKPSSENNYKYAFSIKFIKILTYSKKRFNLFMLMVTIPLSIMYTDMLIKELSCIKASNYIERSIEILRPYVTEYEFIMLRSEFRQVDNQEKFNNILFKINDFATKDSVVLPKSRFYGIVTKK